MENDVSIEEREKTTTIKKSPPVQKHLLGVSQGGVSNRAAQFLEKAEALSKPAIEWSITNEDSLYVNFFTLLIERNKTNIRYARPATGGRKVRHHNFDHDVNDAIEEVKYLCNVIRQCGKKNPIDGTMEITFGQLFNIYVDISSKLVGTLLRARKYHYLTFKEELLLQHRDENVIIKLL
ncbi:unnamed protein product [Adineta steineri]|uniref:Costars domain-containing protein n=1 Tax=Adineta steineri TaxID=433720 RepID=A0A818RW99_9BILA|nr:unnamed protein product [Adineta steineri]CAF3656762.1 unnamed protein product [Adineta steineri]